MIENIMWAISFITLYIAFIWLSFLYLNNFGQKKRARRFPSIDVVVPAYNEEKTIARTLLSLTRMDYPMDKLRIIAVNDGSGDSTKDEISQFIKEHPDADITLINQKNSGKAAALNTALGHSKSELFACVDADSTVGRRALKTMLPHLDEKGTGAVISAIKVNNPATVYEKVQRVEYILAVLTRKIRASINTLAMTPGVLSVYKTKVLKEVGGFDNNNITEDFEIAMRLKAHGYNIKLEPDAYTYTNCPDTFRKLWNQRIRWFRGYLFNHVKYRRLFFSRKHGIFSYFQLPLNMISIPLLIITTGLLSYYGITHIYETGVRIFMIDGYLSRMFYLPHIKDFILAHNMKIMFPIYIAFISGAYMFWVAHRKVKEKLRFPAAIWLYFAALPYLSSAYWITAISQEIMRTKRRW